MLRIFKMYDFSYSTSPGGARVPGQRMAFSSYPGALYSGDDFYLLSSGLQVMETTIGFDNDALNQVSVPVPVPQP